MWSIQMTPTMKTLIDGLVSLLGRGGWQTKKAAYLVVVVSTVAWLSVDLHMHQGITGNWISVYALLLGAVTTGYLGGKRLEKTTGAPNEEGR